MAKAKPESSGPLDRSPSHLLHRALQRALDIYAENAGPTADSTAYCRWVTAVGPAVSA